MPTVSPHRSTLRPCIATSLASNYGEVLWKEVVSGWYDSLYMPVVHIMRQRKVLKRFHRLTEADLYLSIMDHRYYLSREYGRDVGAGTATQDFAVRFGQQNRRHWVTTR